MIGTSPVPIERYYDHFGKTPSDDQLDSKKGGFALP
jgi:hypothetical protein